MLDFVYYPVSAILWFWHKVFGFIPFLGPDSGIAWALSVAFLVFTLRAILYKPFVRQIRTTRQMQELQPQLQALRKKYGKDRQKMAVEMQKLQREHGFNPILGCLPMLLQVPVFIGLYHVLQSFNRTGGIGIGRLNMTVAETRNTPNYLFGVDEVQSFLDARLFGVPLSSYVRQPKAQWQAFVELGQTPDFHVWQIAAVSIPLMVIAAIATHMNARASIARQTPEQAANPQTAIMNRLMLWVFPLGVLVGGIFLPIAILIYWVSQNLWTYGQQHLVFNKIEREEAEAKAKKQETLAANAPKPGAKPVKPKRNKAITPVATDGAVDAENTAAVDDSSDSVNLTKSSGSPSSKASTAKSAPAAASKPVGPKPGAPKPGAKPAGAQARKSGNQRRRSKRR